MLFLRPDTKQRSLLHREGKTRIQNEISASQGGEYEDDSIPGYCAAQSSRNKQTFRRYTQMEAVGISETPVYFYETTRRNIPESRRLYEL
jgi:hypothetical protein